MVKPLSDNDDRFEQLHEVRVVKPSGGSLALKVEGFFPHKGRLVMQFEKISSIEDAETLRGAELRVPIDALPDLPQGSYYHHELKGLEVRDESGASMGRVTEIWETGATPVLVIHDSRQRETLLPLVDAFILEVDVRNGFMCVKASGAVSS